MNLHHHADTSARHFGWCPVYRRKASWRLCACVLFIYAGMATIGGLAAYAEHTVGTLAGASAPQADAWHIASDTASDIVAFTIEGAILAGASNRHVRHAGAYIQVMLLALASALIGFELYHRIAAPTPIQPLLMMAAGGIGVFGNGARFLLLNWRRGGWSITRLIQDRHVRIDLYYSIGVVFAGVVVLATGLAWIDILMTVTIFALALKMTLSMFWQARRGTMHSHT